MDDKTTKPDRMPILDKDSADECQAGIGTIQGFIAHYRNARYHDRTEAERERLQAIDEAARNLAIMIQQITDEAGS